MAIYRAVGQNTYKFVTETNFTLSQDLTVLNRAYAFPIVKYYTSNDSTIKYGVLYPNNNGMNNSSFGIKLTYQYLNSTSGSVTFFYSYKNINDISQCTVDGNIYYGTKSANFYLDFRGRTSSDTAITYYIQPAIYRIIKYQASSGTIITEEYSITSVKNVTETSMGSSYITYNAACMTIPKQANDIILAIETTFPDEE